MLLFFPNPDASPDEQAAALRWFERGVRLAGERMEKDPWVQKWPAVAAEYERTGDYAVVETFVAQLKADHARRFKSG